MNFSSLLNELAGSSGTAQGNNTVQNAGNTVRGLTDKIPGGLAGGAVAGGIVAMLVGSKSARKTAGKAAKYGGAAMLGGLAYKAYKDWQHNSAQSAGHRSVTVNQQAAQQALSYDTGQDNYEREALTHMNGTQLPDSYQMVLIKAMIASARADGHIDGDEQRKISEAIDRMGLDNHAKSQLLDLFLKPVSISDFVGDVESLEQKAEVYLASCLVIDLDHQGEYAHLGNLSKALDLPPGLEHQLRAQAMNALSTSV